MDQRTARWLQIVQMDQDDLAGLHARERLLATRLPASGNMPRFQVENRPHWQDLAGLALTTSRLSPSGYWPAGIEESDKAASVRAFEAAIYPLWAPIEKQDTEREAKIPMSEVEKPGQVLFECSTLHRQDLAIHASGIKPNRAGGDQERMSNLRRKAMKAAGAS